MHLVDPDILADAQGLSPAVCAGGMALGVVLWLFGGRGHRFWLVLLITLAAGIFGLSVAEAYAVQPLVGGLLLAIAAGALALSLMRVLAFVGGGVAACLAAERGMPGWDEPLGVVSNANAHAGNSPVRRAAAMMDCNGRSESMTTRVPITSMMLNLLQASSQPDAWIRDLQKASTEEVLLRVLLQLGTELEPYILRSGFLRGRIHSMHA